MSLSVGIDLGTTFSAVARINPDTYEPELIENREGNRITSSVIRFVDGKPRFGSEAESAFKAGDSGCVATFKRMMGNDKPCVSVDGKPYTALELSSLLLRHLVEDAETELLDKIEDAVITVPAYFGSPERAATKKAAEGAGIKVKQLIDEPCAAALAYGVKNWRENANIFVYDLGGGTFDVTLVRMGANGVLTAFATKGNHELGGRDWDAKLIDLLHIKFSDETELDTKGDTKTSVIIRGLAEDTKKRLSRMDVVSVKAVLPDYGETEVSVSQDEFDDATKGFMEQTLDLCRAILEEANLTVVDITDVLLVGGSTRMPQVKRKLTDMFNKEPISHVNPDEAVALGAAIQATKTISAYVTVAVERKQNGAKVAKSLRTIAKLSKDVKPKEKISIGKLEIKQTISRAMGVITVNAEGTKYVNEVIIPAHHAYPVKAARKFSFVTSSRKDNELKVYVLQGDKDNPLECDIQPEMYIFEGIKHNQKQRGKTEIRIQYSYDHNGIINVQARQEDDNHNLPARRERVKQDDLTKFGRPVEPDDDGELLPEPLSVILAVDVSYSMEGEPLSDAINAMCEFVKRMDMENTQVGVVAFSDCSETVCHLTDSEDNLINKIRSIEVAQTGVSNEAQPFDTIQSMLSYENGRKFTLVLTDGMWEDQPEAIRAAKRCQESEIQTAAIGFGGADGQFLIDISSTDKNAVYVAGSGELSRTFNGFAQSLNESGGSASKGGRQGEESEVETW